jgi:hypothetical protein
MTPPTLQLRRPQYSAPYGYELATLNPDTVVEVLDYLFNTKAWKSNPDLIKRKVMQARLRLFVDGPGTLSDGITRQRNDSLFAGEIPFSEPLKKALAETDFSSQILAEAQPADDDQAWIERGIALRMEGAGWTRLAKELGKPRATLRRVIAKTMDERGLVAPTIAGEADAD